MDTVENQSLNQESEMYRGSARGPHSAVSFTCDIVCHFLPAALAQVLSSLRNKDEEMGSERAGVTCPRSNGWKVTEQKFASGSVCV